ncbi:MAG TPA: hypothetical protein VLU43_13830 [Anaeromyxobacteraceae bacterium]|nr:hypothetical protein [Anaeromyxobacteraceae bacterium]
MRALSAAALAAALLACDSPARVELSPGSLRFFGRGQSLKVHATPLAKNGKPMPERACRWSTSDAKVATVAGPGNDATVSSAGPGGATIRCALEGGATGEVPVSVRVVSRVEIRAARVELKVLDEAAPVALDVQAFDDTGAAVAGRAPTTRCASEDVCRGDGRGQLWAVAAGDTTATAEVEGARSAPIAVHVVDARTAKTRPQRVTGNPMLEIEKLVRERDAAEARKRAKAP